MVVRSSVNTTLLSLVYYLSGRLQQHPKILD
jgi:hypothetical protein